MQSLWRCAMAIQLDHLIVPSRDPVAAARSLAALLDVPWQTSQGPFTPVYVNEALTLDFADRKEFEHHHYCFRVSDAEFDAILGRIRAARQPFPGEEAEPLRRLAVRHEARAARQHEVLERTDPLAVLADLPVDAVRVAREHEPLGHRLLRGDPDEAGGGPRGGRHTGPLHRGVERGRELGPDRPGQELAVLRRGAQPGVEEPQQLAPDAHALLVGVAGVD